MPDLFHSGQLGRVAGRLDYTRVAVVEAIARFNLAQRVGRRFSRRGRPNVLYSQTWNQGARDEANVTTIRYWKDPEWRVKGDGEERTLCLILTHPMTGGRFSSFDYPVGRALTEQQIREKLTAWANQLAERAERMKGL